MKRLCWCAVVFLLVLNLKTERVWGDPSPGTNEANTIVRFEVQRGTNALGSMDVELFDREKPETVRNFLLYVRSGAYSNSFLHRCVPGFVVQGGGFSVTNALATNRFSTFLTVTNYGRLTNEFLVGARLSNTFGTIAMAKTGNDPNSATGQWFLNLADNSTNLDNQNGGFTVFGRVLESTNHNNGTNVLAHFNSLSTTAGIVNLGNLLGSSYQVFNSLPVSYTNTTTRVPTNRELYYAQISIPNETNQPGQFPPTVSLLSPPPNSLFTNQTVTIRGIASDDISVARVVYRYQGGPLEIATGTTNWEASLSPPPGVNTVTVESIDWEGNRSTNVASTSFLYVAEVPLDLQLIGPGSVVGATNGQILKAGVFYTLTATPANGYVFDSWTGAVTSASPTLTFQVPANATNFSLTARFILDPLPQLAGSYHGLFRATNSPALENAGFIAMTLQADGFFSGEILHRGGTYFYTGLFDNGGTALIQGDVGGINRSISLRLQRTNAAGLVTGTILGTATEVQLERLAAALPPGDGPPAGKYTFVIPANLFSPPSQFNPGGNGFGIGAIAQTGVLNISGSLGDGTAFNASASITRLNRWPLYVNLFGGQGVLLGWLSFPTNQPGNLDGALQWIKAPDALASTYPAGFSNQVAFAASPYALPAGGTRVLDWVHGLAQVAGTDLMLGITNLVKLTTSNTLSVVGSNSANTTLSVDLNSGLVSGSFVHPWLGTTNALNGVVLRRGNSIRGQFVEGNQTGRLNVDVTPFLVTQSVVNVTLPGLTTAMSEGGLLRFENDGIITLTNPVTPPFDTALDANGHSVVISGGGVTRLFEVRSNITFSANGITFADGMHAGTNGADAAPPQPGGDGCGAGILNLGGIIGLTNCVLTNFVVLGGDAGIDTTTNGTSASGGRGLGAAICNLGGQVTLQSCLLADNGAVGGAGSSASSTGLVSVSSGAALGAALFSDGGECQIRDTAFLRNHVLGGEARLSGSGGYVRAADAAGGALAIVGGSLSLTGSQCLTNTAAGGGVLPNNAGSGHAYGGALFVETNTTVVAEETIFAANSVSGGGSDQTSVAGTGHGGAAFNAGSLRLRDCTLEQNTALGGLSRPAGPGLGGALASVGALVVESSTFNDNVAMGGSYPGTTTNPVAGAEAAGGAIYAATAPVAVTNSTFAFNRAVGGSGTLDPLNSPAARGDGRGGALAMISNSAVLINVTLAFNEASPGPLGDTNTGIAFGGGIANFDGAVTLRNSIVASNAPANIFGGITDSGYNFSSDASFALIATGSRTNIDPMIGPLTTNGGPARTMALFPASPARDVIVTNHPPVDQRGVARPQGPRGDSGAFEFVQTLPTVVVQPAGTNSVRAGTNFVFQALATGPSPISYSWIKDSTLLSGRTNTTLTLTNVQAADSGNYAAIATNSYGAVTSVVATLVVDSRPLILSQPANVTVAPGASTSVVVTASGPALSYFWFHDSLPVSGATNATLPIVNAAPGVQGSYQVIITNFAGSVTSLVASVTFNALALSILSSPQSVTLVEGGPASFSVVASGVSPISYQWTLGNVPLPGETSSVLTFARVSRTNAGTYRVVVTNAYLALTSAPAVLTVIGDEPLLSISAQGTNVLVTCFGNPGSVHRLLGATILGPGTTWISLATNTLPGSGSFVWTQPAPTNGSIYFRTVTP